MIMALCAGILLEAPAWYWIVYALVAISKIVWKIPTIVEIKRGEK